MMVSPAGGHSHHGLPRGDERRKIEIAGRPVVGPVDKRSLLPPPFRRQAVHLGRTGGGQKHPGGGCRRAAPGVPHILLKAHPDHLKRAFLPAVPTAGIRIRFTAPPVLSEQRLNFSVYLRSDYSDPRAEGQKTLHPPGGHGSPAGHQHVLSSDIHK